MNNYRIVIVFLVLALVISACSINIDPAIERGSGNVVSETRDVRDFDRVILSGIGDVVLVQSDQESLKIEAEDNLIPYIKTEVSDGTLRISFERRAMVPTKNVKFYLTMREIRGLETQGVSNIETESINTDELEIGISGTGNIDIRDLTAQRLSINVSGAGNFTAEGNVDDQSIRLSGAGNYEGEDLESATATVIITGLGRVVLWVTDSLDVTISGTGGVDYYGSPQVSQQISGLGRLNQKGNK